MKIVGVGHIQAQETIIKLSKRKLDVILLPGIGDIIYTWYKLINYVNEGYNFNVKVLDCEPKRSHQIFGCLEGMSSFDYRFDVKKASGFSLRDELTSFQIYCIIFL